MKKTNQIHPTAQIGDQVVMGRFNKIGKNVIIEGFKESNGIVNIGDCNIINDNTRILAGEGGIAIGDWNVFHNDMLVMGQNRMSIGHNCWFGQNTIIDSSGGLEIGNGVRVGMYSQIWTHVASGELIEGCTLFGYRKTVIEDDVWLVGSCIVSSGVRIREKCICLIGSNVTKDTEPRVVYAGSPAKIMEKLNFYKSVSISDKFQMMIDWVKDFSMINTGIIYTVADEQIQISMKDSDEQLLITCRHTPQIDDHYSIFDLDSKTYTKKLTSLERLFYQFIYGHKARFTPT